VLGSSSEATQLVASRVVLSYKELVLTKINAKEISDIRIKCSRIILVLEKNI
jgi:hypothetical protein